jgi:hypothetical protein
MARTLIFLLTALMAMTLLLGGCGEREEKPVAKAAKVAQPIVIPESVQGKWQAVRIAILDKTRNRTEVYTVDLGSEFKVADSEVRLRADNFLPAFVIENKTLTSASNELRNPAVQIVVSEDGKEIFKGWLFSRFPAQHTFQHKRFNFTLVDFIKTPEKKG